MNITGLAIQGFRSFKGDEVLQLPTTPGFYRVSGENGAGKSSIWDALLWCFTSRTSRGLRAGKVANWSREDLTSVTTDFDIDGVDYNLTRTWDPVSLALQEGDLDPRTVTQEEVHQLIGADFNLLTNTILMSQFGRYFLDLSGTEKLTLFSELLNLKFWIGRSDVAREQSKELDVEVASLERQEARLTGSIETLGRTLKEVKAASSEFKHEQRTRLDKLEANFKGFEADCSERATHEKKASMAAAEASEALEEVRAGFIELFDEEQQLKADYSGAAAYAQISRSAVADIINRREESAEGQCESCLQQIDLDLMLDTLAEQLEHAEYERRNMYADADRLQRAMLKVRAKKDRADQQFSRLEDASNLADRQLNRCRSTLTEAQRQVDRLRIDFEREQDRTNPHTSGIKKLKAALAADKEQRGEARIELRSKRARADAFKFWVPKFKDIRLWIIEQGLTELEVSINNSLIDLGLDGWQITFDVEKPKADGQMKNEFTTYITAPGSAEMVPWEAWSGGETQRLRIAGAIGLSDLVCARRGFTPSIEVWDEPTAHLNQDGIDDLLTFFKVRSRQTRRQIWLIDHRSLNAGDFDGEVRIVKDKLGSHIR